MERGGCRRAVALGVALAAMLVPALGAGAATTTTAQSPTTSAGSSTTSGGTTTTVATALPPLPTTPAPVAWVLVDADSGYILDGSNIHTPERTASVVKITTALTGLQRLPPTAPVNVTQDAFAHGAENQNPSGMKVGQTWTVANIVSLMMVISANDAAYALAYATSGSLPQFEQDETSTAHALGMRDSTFNDPAGLDDNTSFAGGPKMSPFDVAIATRDALHVPNIAGPAKIPTYTYTDPSGISHTYSNHNQMLPTLPDADPDATGLKTGSTQRAGDTLAATATRNGRTLIAVIFNCYDRYNWAKALFDRGFLTPAGTTGTGVRLPAVQDLTYEHRTDVKTAALKFLTGTRGLGTGTNTVPLGTATSYQPSTTTVAKTHVVAAGAKHSKSHDGGGGISAVEIVLIVILVLALAVVVLRRRAVRRQRARRDARRRTQAALRRGSLPVVDGRYRAGMRTGKPPQSNVRVHRGRD
ncbi:MAG TPA: hypothetical protein VGI86_19450 [Acidimicrobiia bacterium]|jgi:D-alanyl-D-alanine carboxypeptidase